MEERKRLTFLGFTESQKSCKSCSVHIGCRCPPILPRKWRHRAPSHSGLSSPGQKVNAESHCAPRDQPEKESKRIKKERKKVRHGVTKLQWVRPITYFHKELLYLVFTLREMNDAKSYRVSPNITSVLSLSKPGFFSAYLSHKQCCVHYLLALEACGHFMTFFW